MWGSRASDLDTVKALRALFNDMPRAPQGLSHQETMAWIQRSMTLVVRGTGSDGSSLAAAMRTAVHDIDPTVPLVRVTTMNQAMATSVAPARKPAALRRLAALAFRASSTACAWFLPCLSAADHSFVAAAGLRRPEERSGRFFTDGRFGIRGSCLPPTRPVLGIAADRPEEPWFKEHPPAR